MEALNKIPTPLNPGEKFTCLVVSDDARDKDYLTDLLDEGEWHLLYARDIRQAKKLIDQSSPNLLMCEADVSEGCWRELIQIAGETVGAPVVVVFSHKADEVLWGEVLNLGGYDVLAKPFDKTEVTRVLHLASYQCQWKGSPYAGVVLTN